MASNEIIKKMILKNNDLFKSLDLEVVPVFSDEKNPICNMSGITDDEVVYVHSQCNEYYDEPIFAFRNWGKISSILGMFTDTMDIKIDTEYNESLNKECPSVIHFKSPTVKIKHYLQSYKFYKAQEENNAMYKKKKFILARLNDSNITIDKESIRQVSRAVSILDDKQFKLKIEENDVYVLIGDETKSVDNIKIKLGETNTTDFEESNLISFDYFNAIYKSFEKMSGTNYIKIYQDKIIFTNRDEDCSVSVILRAKNN